MTTVSEAAAATHPTPHRNNVMRHDYRELDTAEKLEMRILKDKALDLWEFIEHLSKAYHVNKPWQAAAELETAKQKVEEAVMWATKYITLSVAALGLLFVMGCTALHEDVKKAAPLVTQACQALPTIAVSVRMASNYVQDQQIKADLATAALVLSETQKLCPPAAPPPSTTP